MDDEDEEHRLINQSKTFISIEPAFRATFPQALVVLVGRSMDTLLTVEGGSGSPTVF